VKKLALAVALASISCSAHSPATAHAINVTDRGGLIRMEGGNLDEAALAAVRVIRGECGERFTVTSLDDPGGAGSVVVAGGGDIKYVPPVWRDLSYQCGGPGSASPLTARVLTMAARAEAAEASAQSKEEAMRRALAAAPCDSQDQCPDGSVCIDRTCIH
jgi:hypothetical protein